METRASSRFVRLTAQKARLVVDLIRGKPVERAIALLEYTPKRGAKTVLKTLRSAVANAEAAHKVDVDVLYVKRAFVDFKRTSHITVVVDARGAAREA